VLSVLSAICLPGELPSNLKLYAVYTVQCMAVAVTSVRLCYWTVT